MEKIIINSGLQHLAEEIFLNLDTEDLKICAQINQPCKHILDNAMFWLKKFTSLSKGNQKDWMKVITQVKNSKKRNAIISYLQWNLKNNVVDLPCYSCPAIQDDFRKKILESCMSWESPNENTQIVKMLAPLTDNINAPDVQGRTPIFWAVLNGLTKIVKILSPLTDNPNAPDVQGRTPIFWAVLNGHTEIVKILSPLTYNPNAPNRIGWTPIQQAEMNGHTEIVNILKSYKKSAKRSTIFEPSFTQSTKRPRKPFNYH